MLPKLMVLYFWQPPICPCGGLRSSRRMARSVGEDQLGLWLRMRSVEVVAVELQQYLFRPEVERLLRSCEPPDHLFRGFTLRVGQRYLATDRLHKPHSLGANT